MSEDKNKIVDPEFPISLGPKFRPETISRGGLMRPAGTLIATSNGDKIDLDKGPITIRLDGSSQMPISWKSIQKIKEWEASPYKQRPEWPEGDSGVTIGYGYDLGHEKLENFESDWKGRLPSDDYDALKSVIGLKGAEARAALKFVKHVTVPQRVANEVLIQNSLPREIQKTVEAFPGSEKLPPDALGALVSLVFNRGPGRGTHTGQLDSRYEMRMIRDSIKNGRIESVPHYLERSKRVWEKQERKNDNGETDLDNSGVFGRRILEAVLFQEGMEAEKVKEQQSQNSKTPPRFDRKSM